MAVTSNKGVEPAMEWLLAHAGEPDPVPCSTVIPIPSEPTTSSAQPATSSVPAGQIEPDQVAKSLKCEDCGKLFRTQDEVEFHAAKSGHSNFSESTEEKKPLTEEEKKEMLVKLEERMKEKRKEREDKEKVCDSAIASFHNLYPLIRHLKFRENAHLYGTAKF